MILGALLLSRRLPRRRCCLYSAAVRAIAWCFSLALDLLCFAVLWIALQWFYFICETLQTDHDVDATNGDDDDGGCVDNMEPAIPDNADIVDSTDESADIAEIVAGNVKNLISKFEVIEKSDTNTTNKQQVSAHVDQDCVAGVVGQMVKRFDGTEKIPISDGKPTFEVISTTTAVIHLIDRFNCKTV